MKRKFHVRFLKGLRPATASGYLTEFFVHVQKYEFTAKKPSYDTDVVEKDLCTVFSPEWLRKAAQEIGLIKRERKIDPTIMFWVLAMSFGVRLQRTLASIKRNYEKASNEKMSDSSWYERFTPELVAFLKLCVTHAKRLSENSFFFTNIFKHLRFFSGKTSVFDQNLPYFFMIYLT